MWTGYFCNSFIRKPLDRHITKVLNGEYHVQGYGNLLKVLLCIVVVDFIIVSGIYAIVRRDENLNWAHSDWKH